ncbi:rhodopsin-like [Diadema antillarum]|uniref:rhodopsin-like n=1 Tax=Diadema antillarum TaxID=105358 RepID=UPI003A864EF7
MPISMDIAHSTPSTGEGRGQNEDKPLQALSLSVILLCALSFNFMTIVVILRTRSLRRNPHTLLMLNLAVADLGVALASMTFSMASIFDEGRFLESHRTACKVNGFFSTWFTFTNLPLIFSIAFDRFLIIVCSPRHAPPKRLRIGLLIAMSWTMGFMVALTAATGWLSEFRYNVHTKHCSPTETAAPASKDDPSVDSVEADYHGNKEDNVPAPLVTANRKSAWRTRRRRHLQAHSRVARLGAVLVFMSIVCWTPYLLIHANYIRVSEDHWFGVFTMWLAYCNAVLDPLVYSCMNRRVRAELWKLARRVRCCGLRRSVTFNVRK